MSDDRRATTSELAAEFERAMGSLADSPVDADSRYEWFRLVGRSLELLDPGDEATDADYFVRIAAIALEGAARLRRGM